MLTVYMFITWGTLLPVLLLICLAADVATGTTLLHRPKDTDHAR